MFGLAGMFLFGGLVLLALGVRAFRFRVDDGLIVSLLLGV